MKVHFPWKIDYNGSMKVSDIFGSQTLIEMSNLIPEKTGIEGYTLWFSVRGKARHGPRIKVSKGVKWQKGVKKASVSIPYPKQVFNDFGLPPEVIKLIGKWIVLNRKPLLDCWYGKHKDYDHTESLLRPLGDDILHEDKMDMYLMSAISAEKTGLNCTVWISIGESDLPPRIKISKDSKGPFATVPINGIPRVIKNIGLSKEQLQKIYNWVKLNRKVLIRHWNGDIFSSSEAISLLKKVS
jgi:hypothetical protein